MNRNWTVLFIGGASGMGKSSVANELARFYKVNIIEVDDICQAIKAMTTREILKWHSDYKFQLGGFY